GISYWEHVAVLYPAERVGAVASSLVYGFALLPSAVSGTAASVIGYVAGHLLSRSAGEEVDEARDRGAEG
ncbi:MAG: hypothetical protein JSV41_08940, partial [Gemmatimonadota bacterium]